MNLAKRKSFIDNKEILPEQRLLEELIFYVIIYNSKRKVRFNAVEHEKYIRLKSLNFDSFS